MTKSELRDGMVLTRSGAILFSGSIVIGDKLFFIDEDDNLKTTKCSLKDYNDDLTYIHDEPWKDIVKVEYMNKVIWERTEYITLAEAIKKGDMIKARNWEEFLTVESALAQLPYESFNMLKLMVSAKMWLIKEDV